MTKIKATLRFNRLPDADLLKHLNTVYERMNGNPLRLCSTCRKYSSARDLNRDLEIVCFVIRPMTMVKITRQY